MALPVRDREAAIAACLRCLVSAPAWYSLWQSVAPVRLPGYSDNRTRETSQGSGLADMELELTCTGCGVSLPLADPACRCRSCGEPLEIRGYRRPSISERPWPGRTLVERYGAFLPPVDSRLGLTMGEGFTPLVDAPRLADALGIRSLLIKNETVNPTWSFKDRGTVVAMADALSRGCRAVGVVSTGNMAASVAAYGARAGVPVLVLVNAETPAEKLPPVAVYGCTVVRVDGDYGALYYRSLELKGVRFLNSDAPARVEGSKTIAFEICEQCSFVPPDWVVVPTSSGGNLRGILKGFEEMREANLISRVPKVVCAQASGCAPIATAWEAGGEAIVPVGKPHTIAHAIANPSPPSGNAVLRKLRGGAGTCVAVTDDSILDAQIEMASAGVYGQPAAAAALAAVHALASSGVVGCDDTVVCVATGGGLKVTGTTAGRLPPCLDSSLDALESTASAWLRRTSATGVNA